MSNVWERVLALHMQRSRGDRGDLESDATCEMKRRCRGMLSYRNRNSVRKLVAHLDGTLSRMSPFKFLARLRR
jgi:hypothetical protein